MKTIDNAKHCCHIKSCILHHSHALKDSNTLCLSDQHWFASMEIVIRYTRLWFFYLEEQEIQGTSSIHKYEYKKVENKIQIIQLLFEQKRRKISTNHRLQRQKDEEDEQINDCWRNKESLFWMKLTYLSRRRFILIVAVVIYNKWKQNTNTINMDIKDFRY